MAEQDVERLGFDFFSRLPIVVEAHNTLVTSDAGILPLREFDCQIGLTERFIACLEDRRDPEQIDHSFAEMVRQRLFGILAGYEDCNDHDALRNDPAFKMVSGKAPNDETGLASQPTLSRFENAVSIACLWRLHDFFLDDFIRSFKTPPAFLTLDIDAVDDPCHGQQQLALFHGFYDQYQYLPLVVSCAETKQILWPSLRPGSVHAALGADDDLEYIAKRLRAAWPDVVIHVRGDAGFGMPWMYAVCERLQLLYTFGLSTNNVLKQAADSLLQRAVRQFEETRETQRLFDQFLYRAGSWKNPRRVIVKAECNRVGTNLRFIVSNRSGAGILPQAAYDEYAERGESENRNKELKCGLAGDRLSCHRFVANYFRLMLHTAALNLLVRLRALVADPPALTAANQADQPSLESSLGAEAEPAAAGDTSPDAALAGSMKSSQDVPVQDPTLPVAALTGHERRRYHNYRRRKDPLGQGHIDTWRTCLIKVAGEVIQSARRILVRIPAHWPGLAWFRHVCRRLDELRRSAQVQT
ncbi:MAG: IS1380 family transposase [Acidimicrobiia bacterium]|nr:IS1380 family transposase [Acidimicrobiia bacterium]